MLHASKLPPSILAEIKRICWFDHDAEWPCTLAFVEEQVQKDPSAADSYHALLDDGRRPTYRELLESSISFGK